MDGDSRLVPRRHRLHGRDVQERRQDDICQGAALKDPARLFNSGLDGNVRRAGVNARSNGEAGFVRGVPGGRGAARGAAVWSGPNMSAGPGLGLAPPVTQSHTSSEIAEFFAHLAYGCTTELVRSGVRLILRA